VDWTSEDTVEMAWFRLGVIALFLRKFCFMYSVLIKKSNSLDCSYFISPTVHSVGMSLVLGYGVVMRHGSWSETIDSSAIYA